MTWFTLNAFATLGLSASLLGMSAIRLPNSSTIPNDQNIAPKQVYKVIGAKGFDAASTIVKSKTGSYILIGRSDSYGSGDMNLNAVMVSENGDVIWNKNYGADESEEGFCGLETSNGDFLFAGYSDSYGAGPDMKEMYIVYTDKSGSKVWEKTFGSKETIAEAASVVEAPDGGFIVVGTSSPISGAKSDIMVVKVDAKGNKVWDKKIGNATAEQAHQVIALKDGGFAIIGSIEVISSGDKGKWDMFLVKIDKDGNKTFEKNFGGGDNEMGNSVCETPEGDFILGGYTYTYAEGSHDAWIMKIDKNGGKKWDKVIGGLSTDEIFDLKMTPNGDVVAAGYTDIYEADEYGENKSPLGQNILIVKISSKGDMVFDKRIGGNKSQVAKGIALTKDGGFIIGGYTDELADDKSVEMLVVKVDASGN